MSETNGDRSDDLESYRRYLRFLARTLVPGRYPHRLDASDIVQKTMLRAYEKRCQYRGTSRDEKLGWLRSILIRNIQREVRYLHAQRRDVKREMPILKVIEQSSVRLSSFLVSSAPEPSKQVCDQEGVVAVANAIESLPELQRQVIVFKYWNQLTFKQIAVKLETTVPAAIGEYRRARRELKRMLAG